MNIERRQHHCKLCLVIEVPVGYFILTRGIEYCKDKAIGTSAGLIAMIGYMCRVRVIPYSSTKNSVINYTPNITVQSKERIQMHGSHSMEWCSHLVGTGIDDFCWDTVSATGLTWFISF